MSQATISFVAAQVRAAFAAVSLQQQHVQSAPVEVSFELLSQVGGGASVDSPRNGW